MLVRLFTRTVVAVVFLSALAATARAQTAHPSFNVKVTGTGPAVLLIPGLLAQVTRIKSARVIMADKARHFIMFDDPSFLFAAMDQFLGAK